MCFRLRRWKSSSAGLCQRRVLTLRASDFPEIFQRADSVTDTAFKSDPLSKLPEARRGIVIQRIVKQTLKTTYPTSIISEPPCGLRWDGTRRSGCQSEVDWIQDGRKVECKSTRIAWSQRERRWRAKWMGVKLCIDDGMTCAFDDLLLVLHCPSKLYIVWHDFGAGVARNGFQTGYRGHQILSGASSGTLDVHDASRQVIQKLTQAPNACRHAATLRCDADTIGETILCHELDSVAYRLSWGYYEGVPLSHLSSCSRALRLQEVAYQMDQMLHPRSIFSYGVDSDTIIGEVCLQRRGVSRGSADWLRDGSKVEFKSSKLRWHVRGQRWVVEFCGIKDAPDTAFDELLLGLYTPFALYLFRYAGKTTRSTANPAVALLGRKLTFTSSANPGCMSLAVESLLRRLEIANCQLLGRVLW